MLKKFFSIYFYSLLFLTIFIFFLLKFYNFNSSNSPNYDIFYFNTKNNIFSWPTPGYYTITSYFGPRKAPAGGASSNHSGIDIAAPNGTDIYSICDGIVNYTEFKGANGYSISIKNNNIEILYCHVSPNFIIKKNDIVSKN